MHTVGEVSGAIPCVGGHDRWRKEGCGTGFRRGLDDRSGRVTGGA